MKKTPCIALFAMALSPLAVLAESPGWTFVEASYLAGKLESQSNDVSDFEPEGGEMAASIRLGEGSMSIMDSMFFDVRYSAEEDDIEIANIEADVDFDRWSIGLGSIWEVTDTTHLYGRLGYENWEIDVGIADRIKDMLPEDERDDLENALTTNESGYSLSGGVRAMVWNGLELRGEVSYSDLIESEVGYTAGIYYTIVEHFTVGTSISTLDDLDSWRATLRYQF